MAKHKKPLDHSTRRSFTADLAANGRGEDTKVSNQKKDDITRHADQIERVPDNQIVRPDPTLPSNNVVAEHCGMCAQNDVSLTRF